MRLTTAEQMLKADRRAIGEYGIPSIRLMEAASRAVAEAAKAYLRPGGTALIFCGSGNNGGDGVGAAVEFLRTGYNVRVFLVGNRAHTTPDWREMERRLTALGGSVEDFREGVEIPPNTEVIVDAVFGVGLSRPVAGRALTAIEAINAAPAPVMAADIPSGVAADTGQVLGAAVRADVTVTFSLAKIGHFAEPGCVCRGRLEIADIGIPKEILDTCETGISAIEDGEVRLPKRPPLSHKGDYGKILILGGSVGYTGAPTLCARAAVRAGAGLVYLGVPAPIYEITAVKNDEAMPFPLAPGGGVPERLRDCDVCAVGCGMGRGEDTLALVKALLELPKAEQKPLVLDADALNALAGRLELLDAYEGTAVLTPHEGEFLRLGGALTGDRVSDARRFSEAHGCVLLLKGHRALAAFPDGEVFIATHGNPGMAKGGSGDALTGVLAAMLGQFPGDVRRAVCTAMTLHALAGDLCRDRYGEYAMTATDLIETLPEAAKQLKEE